jgi:pimeloyl-ACP methyl ester carboxylesterase
MANEKSILQKDWNEIRSVLKKGDSNNNSRSLQNPDEKELRNYFGDVKFEKLRGFAQDSDNIRRELGNVILLPGIMGSSLLSIKDDGDEDTIWLSLRSLAFGRLPRLELNDDGKTNKNGENIKAPKVFGGLFRGFMFDYYSLALEALQAEHFSYDWRLDIRSSAVKLAEFIKEKFAGEKVSLVAHSMGGLVARSFIKQFPDLWKTMKGNLIMLGTPNHGSFDAVQGLIGENRTIQKLEKFDIHNSLSELMTVFHSFPGLYQLLPEKSFDSRIYQKETWNRFPTVKFDTHLLDVEKFYQELSVRETTDDKRMFYIAGTGFETLVGIKNIQNGVFEFETTTLGDGTVSHKLGRLDGIKTYYDTDNEHSDLLNGENALEAIVALIQNQTPKILLETEPLASNLRSVNQSATIDSNEEELVDAIIGAVRSGESLEPEQIADAERKIQRAIWGGKEYKQSEKTESKTLPHPIEVELVENNIADSEEPIIVVGKYSDLPPRGACSAIDKKLDYRLSLGHITGIIGSELGQLFFVPEVLKAETADTKTKNQTIILAGAGSYGKFKRDDLRYLTMNIALAVLSLGKNRFGIVMIGTGLNDFSVDRAIRSILSGIADALARFPKDKEATEELVTTKAVSAKNKTAARLLEIEPEMTVVIYETKPERFDNLKTVISDLTSKIKNIDVKKKDVSPIENVNIIFDKDTSVKGLTAEARNAQEQKTEKRNHKSEKLPYWVLSDEQKNVTRITVERNYATEKFLLSALTPTAALPVREISIQNCIIDSLTEKLRKANNLEKQQKYGRLLHAMLIPEDFQGLIDTNKPLVLLLDKFSASIPWEMVCYGGSHGLSTFGVELQLSRQFSLLSAVVASVPPPLNDEFKVLIIANPASGDLHLEGAAREGRELKEFFETFSQESEIKIKVDTCIGENECDIVEVLSKIFSQEYDLIHFSGHGCYDPDDETNSGWVFGTRKITEKINGVEIEREKLLVISPREIFRLRKVPRLIFANACFSSQTADGNVSVNQKISASESGKKLAGIAEAFFSRGIENYIGAGWQVNDSLAVKFAKTFYETVLTFNPEKDKYHSLSEALGAARKEIKEKVSNTTWGAYQHYGDANAKLIHIKSDNKGKNK